MPDQRLARARESLPSGYQFGACLDSQHRFNHVREGVNVNGQCRCGFIRYAIWNPDWQIRLVSHSTTTQPFNLHIQEI